MSPYLKVIPKVWRSWIDPLNRDLKNFFKIDMFEKNVHFFATIFQKRLPATAQATAGTFVVFDYLICYDLIVCHSKPVTLILTVLCMFLFIFLLTILYAEEMAVAFWHYEDTNLARYVYSSSHTANRRPMQNSSAASLNSI